MSLNQLSALEAARRVRAGEVRAVELLEASYAQIRAVDGVPGRLDSGAMDPSEEKKVHAFITLTEDLAYTQAQAVDQQVAEGKDPGPLAGVPVSIKDIFCMDGTLTTAASRILSNFKPPYTATAVERLIAAGAVTVGKVNMDEFAYGSSSESSAYQPCPFNPWDPEHVTGGSSGGSAASVASEEVALSLGTDTSGSIRQPAAFCGITGLKPTYGRVSRYGCIAFGSSLDCVGPMGRDVSDTAQMLQVIAGQDPRDATSSVKPPVDYLEALKAGVKGLRIGLSPDFETLSIPDVERDEVYEEPLQAEVSRAVLDAAEVLASMGAEIVEGVRVPTARFAIPAYFVISRVEASSNLHRFDGVKYGFRSSKPAADLNTLYRQTRAEGFGPVPKLRILMGMYVSAAQHAEAYYQRALKVRAMIRRDFEHIFDPAGEQPLDLLLTPTTATTAFKRNAFVGNSVLMQYADQLVAGPNHAGLPAISIPGGLDEGGLPIGLQFIGFDFREDLLLRAGYAFEQATSSADWRQKRPAVLAGQEARP